MPDVVEDVNAEMQNGSGFFGMRVLLCPCFCLYHMVFSHTDSRQELLQYTENVKNSHSIPPPVKFNSEETPKSLTNETASKSCHPLSKEGILKSEPLSVTHRSKKPQSKK